MKTDRWRYATCTIEAITANRISTVRVTGLVNRAVVVQAVANNSEWLEATDAASQVIDLRKMSATFTARDAFTVVSMFIGRGLRAEAPAAFIVPGGVMKAVTLYCLLMGQIGAARAAFETEPEAQAWAQRRAASRIRQGSSATLVEPR